MISNKPYKTTKIETHKYFLSLPHITTWSKMKREVKTKNAWDANS